MTTQTSPALDCPGCPECTLLCGTTADAPDGLLRCAACGHTWTPGPNDIAQAKAADAAWKAPPCPNIDRALELAADWAAGHASETWPLPAPHPELLVWVSVFMYARWGGDPIGSALTTGMNMAWKLGAALEILGDVRPVGMHGVLPLCEAAGWPVHPGPDDEPLPPIR